MLRSLRSWKIDRILFLAVAVAHYSASSFVNAQEIPSLPEKARLVLEEDWGSGEIDSERWYLLRKQWGEGNRGVVPENVSIEDATVGGESRKVLVCRAHGDHYEGPVTGQWGEKTRVGGVIVSKAFFASGRFEISMKIGEAAREGGPEGNFQPPGVVPAIWTYGYRHVSVPEDRSDAFSADNFLYHPYLQHWGKGAAYYWSELDFPEFGKMGEYGRAMYNTFLNGKHDNLFFDVGKTADGAFHRFTTDWHTHLVPIEGIRDDQVVEADGFWWIHDLSVDFGSYFGNPLKRLGADQYAVCAGRVARHWIDGKFIGENTKWVPSMAAQLNFGVWLPEWAGPAPWDTTSVTFADVRVWQFDEAGDVRGILVDDITNNFDEEGKPVRP